MNNILVESNVNPSLPDLTICLMAKTDVCGVTMACLMGIMNNKTIEKVVNLYITVSLDQSDLPKARSSNLTRWYRTAKEKDLFMFLDSDQTFSYLDILKSLSYMDTHDVVCGAYAKKSGGITSVPKNQPKFYKDKEGELAYGATGFMMIRKKILTSIEKDYPGVYAGNEDLTIPFFLERIVRDDDIYHSDIWLSEDYSFSWLIRKYGGSIWGYISPTIGHLLPTLKQVDNICSSKWPENSIVYYCGETHEAWSPNSLKNGIGGSEQAVIRLSRYWASKGRHVVVYCKTDEPGTYENVIYKKHTEFNAADEFATIILWRSIPVANTMRLNAKNIILDLHDLVDPSTLNPLLFRNVDKIFVKSKMHGGLLVGCPEDKIVVIPNGGKINKKGDIQKDKNYIIYASSYDRGLPFMLKWGWPKIKKVCPDAYMKVYYGWDLFDKVREDNEDTKLYKSLVLELLAQEGVEECGRISHEKLLIEKEKASFHYYVGDFQEIDCISVRESASLGCIPVVSDYVEVFNEKEYCHKIHGDPKYKDTQEKAAEEIIKMMKDDEYYKGILSKTNVSDNETWDSVAEKWLSYM